MIRTGVGDIEPVVGQIAEARRKSETEQVAEAEHVVGRAAGIGIVLRMTRELSWWSSPSRTCVASLALAAITLV